MREPPGNDRLLSILVPLYNEAEFIQAVLKRIVICASSAWAEA